VAACVVRQDHRRPCTSGRQLDAGYAVRATLLAVAQPTATARTLTAYSPVRVVPAVPQVVELAAVAEPANASSRIDRAAVKIVRA
jgi:hypothetical protein